MFVDASVMVAVLNLETDAARQSARLERASGLFTSPIAVFETVVAVMRKSKLGAAPVYADVTDWLAQTGIEVRTMDETVGNLAIEAFAAYGKGRGHPAQLNMGDCFAYAMAKRHRVPLLYKGEDFARTDLA